MEDTLRGKTRPDFWNGRRVLVTGHTGFKGTWLCTMLDMLGAEVTGYALAPGAERNLFAMVGDALRVRSEIGDIRDLPHLKRVFEESAPEVVFHLAAQPIVRESYKDPVCTYETNVMGTVHVMEAVRNTPGVKSLVVITTDKVYKNREWDWGYRENEELNGFDPYSNSKSCAELVTDSYRNSFFAGGETAISTARAGNVIGGGDFAVDRIVPDFVRAVLDNERLVVRNPHSVRPYQHVLEPLGAYLLLAQRQYEDGSLAGCYNIGPEEKDCVRTGELAELLCSTWNSLTGGAAAWVNESTDGPHEANFLKLDCSKIKSRLSWMPRWGIQDAVRATLAWVQEWNGGGDVYVFMRRQIREYMEW